MARLLVEDTEKVTLSLPRRLVEFADRAARTRGVSRSRVVAEVLAEAAAKELDELAAEGYRFYAEESRDFADASLGAASEAVSREANVDP